MAHVFCDWCVLDICAI